MSPIEECTGILPEGLGCQCAGRLDRPAWCRYQTHPAHSWTHMEGFHVRRWVVWKVPIWAHIYNIYYLRLIQTCIGPQNPIKNKTIPILERFQLVGLSFQSGFKGKDGVPKMVKAYLDKKVKLDEFITHRMPLESVNDAIDLMKHGKW